MGKKNSEGSRNSSRLLKPCLIQRFVDLMPKWTKSTAAQQGMMFWCFSLLSLLLVSNLTLLYVEGELEAQNEAIYVEAQRIAHNRQEDQSEYSRSETPVFGYFPEYSFEDEPIDDDEIIDIMSGGFLLTAIFQSILSAVIVALLVRFSNTRVRRLEQVLASAADGDLSARTHVKHTNYDLARVAVSVDEMLARLQGSIAAMSDISSNIAHELKTPITRLRHNLLTIKEEAMKIEVAQTDEFYHELDHVLDESMRLASTFDALLRISQIESGARRSRFSQLELNDVIALVSDIYTDVADEAGMRLESKMAHYSIQIQGDRDLLIQQVANLIENALRYCHSDCVIKLNTGINIQTQQAWITVEDNGPGIPADERKRVFERLYRIDKSRTDGGLGLGLSFAQAVSKLHYGSIALYDCAPGLGVKIELPLPATDQVDVI